MTGAPHDASSSHETKADEVAAITYKHLRREIDRHGNVRFYVRFAGRRVRIKHPEGSPEFVAEHQELVRQIERGAWTEQGAGSDTAIQTGTLAWLVVAYMRSPTFRDLDVETQKNRRNILASVLAEPIAPGERQTYRNFPLTRITMQALAVLRDRKVDFRHAANNRIKVLRALFGWACEEKHVDSDPTIGLKKLRAVTGGHHSWTMDEIEQFEARHPLGTKARLAITLMLFTGARRSDAVRLGKQHMQGGRLRWTAYKNRNRHPVQLDIPIAPKLQMVIEAGPVGRLMFLETEQGKSFSNAGFGNWFRDRCNEAGLPHCSAHGLRKAGATLAAENGASAHELMALFGWSKIAQAETYTKAAERTRLSTSGMGKMLLIRGTEGA
jgi:integrase